MDSLKLNPFVRSASVYESAGRLGECVAYDCRVIYVISGDITATVNKEKLGHMSAGKLLYIPAGTSYKLRGQYFRIAVICFDTEYFESAKAERIYPVAPDKFDDTICQRPTVKALESHVLIEDMESDRDAFIEICNLFTSAEGLYREKASALLKLLLIKICELGDENALPSRMVENLDKYIRENVGDEISNTEIGAIFGYHPFYVSKVLKEKKGQTLRQYIISYRLKSAKKMLEVTAKSVGEIAEECGFTDASYFTKTFKSVMGITPKEYRNQFKDEFI
jgi:AraC-like DNA-binding protein